MTPKKYVIKTFEMAGSIEGDQRIITLKEQFIKLVETEMRGRGYLRIFDLDPRWILNYDATSTHYDFYLELYGLYVGEKKARENAGITNWKLV